MATPNEFGALWEDALKKYTDQSGINLLKSEFASLFDKCHSESTVVGALETEMDAFKKFRGNDSKWAKLRDKLKLVVRVLLLFNDTVAEAASSLIPGGKSILVAFAVLLAATKGVSELYDGIVYLFEQLDSFLGRLHTRLQASSSLEPHSKRLAVEILAHFLCVLGLSTKLIKDGSRFKDFLKVLSGNKDMKDALARLDELTNLEMKGTIAETWKITTGTRADVEKLLGLNREMKTTATDTRADVKKLLDLKIDNNIKTWLSAPDPSISHNKFLDDMRHKKPGSWLLEHDEYISWKTRNNSVFWIYGSPGTGKSVLCFSIIETLMATRSLAYFYCTFADEKTQNSRGLLSSLISRLAIVSPDCLATLRSFHSSHSVSGAPSEERLFECLCQMLTVSGDVFVVIDALEECPTRPERAQMLKHLERMVELGHSQLHILITSRPEVDIKPSMARMKAHQLDLEAVAAQAKDLRSYISSELAQADWGSKLREHALETLTAKANGSFRWVACQLVSLEGCLRCEVKKILDTLPKDIEETYLRILQRIPSHRQFFAARIFHMIAFAKRPLSSTELAEVFTVGWDTETSRPHLVEDNREEHQAQKLLEICSSLIRIAPGNSSQDHQSLVEFSHFTVHEYLKSVTGKLEIYRLDAEPAHTTLAQMCLASICSAEYRAYVPERCAAPFNEYATLYWMDHSRHGNVSTTISPLLLQIFDQHFEVWSAAFDSCPHPLAWSRIDMQKSPEYQDQRLPLLCAAHNGFLHIVEHLIAQQVDVNQQSPVLTREMHTYPDKTDAGLTALHLSSMGGHREVAEFLLEHNACIEARSKHGRTALQLASAWGQIDIVRLLLSSGANITATSEPIYSRQTVLHRVSVTGDVDLACRVLDKNVDIEARDGLLDQTALHLACERLHPDMVGFLLKRGACIEARDEFGRTPLNIASRHNCVPVVQILLDHRANHRANIHSQDKDGNTAVHHAVAGGCLAVVHILLAHRSDSEVRNLTIFDRSSSRSYSTCTARELASHLGYTQIVEALVQHKNLNNPMAR
ncbi:hypothetical protein B0H13DRAFT_1707918 [Mycena leptocephala]|nr:hypothetical protein B0H13DRAFT_1707918 [Mycena leptocephala]